jgi:hypothetical protein
MAHFDDCSLATSLSTSSGPNISTILAFKSETLSLASGVLQLAASELLEQS